MPHRFRAFTMMLVIAACVAAPPAAGNEQQDDRIVFQGMAQAFANGVANEKVTVLVFGAEWCPSCKKLERSVLTVPAVLKAGSAMSWAKIDIDKDPNLAAMFGVRAVPTMVFLNTKGEPLHTQGGLVPVERLTALLSRYADKAAQPGTARGRYEQLMELVDQANQIAEGADVPSETVHQILELIAVPNPIGIDEARHRLIAMGPSAWHGMVDALEHEKLAVRAAAYDVLKETTGKVIAYDPFLGEAKRAKQVKAWRDWLENVRPKKAKPEPEKRDDSSDGEEPKKSTPRAPR